MSKFSEMEVFTCVVDEESFSGAARTLGVSKSYVSKQISKLTWRPRPKPGWKKLRRKMVGYQHSVGIAPIRWHSTLSVGVVSNTIVRVCCS